MKTKPQLIKAFNAGQLEDVLKECRLYGVILKDKSFDVESGFYAGANRIFTIKHKNLYWRFEMLNGDVKRCSYTVKHDE